MERSQILILWAIIFSSMLLWRVGPLVLLEKRELPDSASRAISYIPVAAFAALITNDLFQPEAIASRPSLFFVELVAAALSVFMARRFRSLILSALVGMASFAILSFLLP